MQGDKFVNKKGCVIVRFRRAKGVKTIERLYRKINASDYAKDYVEVERFLECCKQCPNYNTKWSCPPYDFDVMERYWNNYKYLHLFAVKVTLADDIADSVMTPEQINDLVMRIRHQNYMLASRWIFELEKENPGSVALDGGHCDKCKRCTRAKGFPCRYGKEIHPAIDAIGGNLVKTAEEIFGTKILWIENGKVPEYFLFIVGLLSNEENIKEDF